LLDIHHLLSIVFFGCLKMVSEDKYNQTEVIQQAVIEFDKNNESDHTHYNITMKEEKMSG